MNTTQTQATNDTEQHIIAHIFTTGKHAACEASAHCKQIDFLDSELSILYDAMLSLVSNEQAISTETITALLHKHKPALKEQIKLRELTTDADTVINNIAQRTTQLHTLCTKQLSRSEFHTLCLKLKQESMQRRGIPTDTAVTTQSRKNKEHISILLNEFILPIAFGGPELTYVSRKKYLDKNCHTGMAMLELEAAEEEHALVQGMFRKQSVNIIFGEEGCGKSLLAMNLALGIATGASRFLEHEITTHGNVLYLNNELPFSEFLIRFKKMARALPAAQQEQLDNIIVPETVPPFDEYWRTINDICCSHKPVLIILDCLYWSHEKQENNSSGMKAVMRNFAHLRDTYNLAMVILHHTKKRSRYQSLHSNNMRGSGVFGAATDTNIELRRSEKDETMRILKPTKLRYSNDTLREPHLLTLSDTSLWFEDKGEVDESEHIGRMRKNPFSFEVIDFKELIKPGETLSRKDIIERCKPFGYDKRTIDRALKQAKEFDTVKCPEYGYYTL